jgi:L-threonylcarbamoyladenylate synthase
MSRRWHIDERPTAVQMHEIARTLEEGKVVLLPTDTIYGLHARALDDEAVARVAEIKGRDDTKPFIVLADSTDQFAGLGIEAAPEILDALRSIWPAPLTVILRLREPIPASRGMLTLAVRIPALEWLRELVSRTGPLVSTSANRSGEAPIESPAEVARDLQSRIDATVDAGPRSGEASAILDLTRNEPRFIREGEHSFTQNVWKTLRKSL